MLGIIGGSGLYNAFDSLKDTDTVEIGTNYGTVKLITGRLNDRDIVFLSRHGTDEKYPPHAIDHRANLKALKRSGVDRLIATSAVGVLKFRYELGKITLPDQLVDMTKKIYTFHNGGDEGIVHSDISDPFCIETMDVIRNTMDELGLGHQCGGTYLCLSGPTFETKAEIKLFQMLGMSFVGMTIAPECKLARELGLCYAPILLPVNYGAGMTDELITHDTTLEMVDSMMTDISNVLERVAGVLPEGRDCDCTKATSGM